MAEGRFISKRIAVDRELNALSQEALLLFLMTIPHLDRDGLILGDDSLLWGAVAPRRLDLLSKVDSSVQEWVGAGLVIAYETRTGRCLYFPGFRKNQQGLRYDREAESRLPPPPGFIRTPTGLVEDTPATRRSNAGVTPDTLRQLAEFVRPEVEVEVEVEVEGEAEEAPPVLLRQSSGNPPAILRHHAGTTPEDYDRAVRAFVAVYEANIGLVPPAVFDDVKEWVVEAVDRGLEPWLEQAVREAVSHNARTWVYVRSILRRCFDTGTPPGAGLPSRNGNGQRGNAGLAAVEARRAETPAQPGLLGTDDAAGIAAQFRRA